MKTIKVPADITIKDPATGEEGKPQTFKAFVLNTVLSDKTWGENYQALKAATKLEALFAKADAGSVVEVEDADYEKLKTATERPASGYNPVGARFVFAFLEAIMNAE